MKCNVIKLNEDDQFISKIKNGDSQITTFYEYDVSLNDSFSKRLKTPNNGREEQLSSVIKSYMGDLDLSESQMINIDDLAKGAKVVIGGQQAGMFGGPLYTFHKIFSIITLSNELTDQYNEKIIPVFWIAGEDHDFDEVNHTFAFNHNKATLNKIKYHTMTPPESNVTRFTPDKEALLDALNQFFKELTETQHSNEVYQLCRNIILRYESWTDIFKGLLHEIFKEYGLLLLDAQFSELRKMEKPILKNMLEKRESLDQAFRNTQFKIEAQGLKPMIQTDTNTHLFIHEENMRQLLTYEDGKFITSKSDISYSKEDLFEIIDNEPERISNNVVTRPVMEEWLFNTVAFIGGPSEIKYWAELKEVFNLLDVEMPIVLPRLRISYMYDRTQKLLNQYNLKTEMIISHGVEQDRQKFVREKASQEMIDEVEQMKAQQQKLTERLKAQVTGNHDNELLVEKNNEIHQKQYDYLLKRYLLNVERENDISMRQFREINEVLHPMGGLQERIWNPIQIMNDFGKDVFNPSTYPPLQYTFNHIIIKP